MSKPENVDETTTSSRNSQTEITTIDHKIHIEKFSGHNTIQPSKWFNLFEFYVESLNKNEKIRTLISHLTGDA